MANTTLSRTYTDFVTATGDKILSKSFTDNISRASPFMSWMMDEGGVTGRANGRRYLAGATGNYLEEPIMTELNGTGKWYAGAETVDTTQQNVGTAAFWQPKRLIISATITGEEADRNAGREKTINLTKAKIDQALISIRVLLAGALWADGTGNNGKEIFGITALCPSDRGTSVASGTVTANTSWWLCQRSRSGTTYGNVGDYDTNFKAYGRRLFLDCSEGGSQPDIHLVDQSLYEKYDDSLKPMERHESKKMLDLGFENYLTYFGKPVIWDRYHPDANSTTTHRWFMLNSEFLALRYLPSANFSQLGFQRPPDADYITTPIIWSGAMTTSSRRMHGVATGITIS